MRNIVGALVTGTDFYFRKREVDKLQNAIDSDADILFTAPKRTGKSSILLYLRDNPRSDSYVYEVVNRARSQDDFYKILISLLDNGLPSPYLPTGRKLKKGMLQIIRMIREVSFGGAKVKIDSNQDKTAYDRFRTLLKTLKVPEKTKLVIMIDEYPEVIENIKADHGEMDAIAFIQGFTDIRKNPGKYNNIRFLFTGSIGLEGVVKKLNNTHLITDLLPIHVTPLTTNEGREFVGMIMAGLSYDMSDSVIDSLLHEIGWITPYYLQIVLKELNTLAVENRIEHIEKVHIETVLDDIVKIDLYFSHWRERLNEVFSIADARFAVAYLSELAKENSISLDEYCKNLSSEMSECNSNHVLGMLVKDGYVQLDKQSNTHSFCSKLVGKWWLESISNTL